MTNLEHAIYELIRSYERRGTRVLRLKPTKQQLSELSFKHSTWLTTEWPSGSQEVHILGKPTGYFLTEWGELVRP